MSAQEVDFFEIKVIPSKLDDRNYHNQLLVSKYPRLKNPSTLVLERRSIDARKGNVHYVLRYKYEHDIPAPNGFKEQLAQGIPAIPTNKKVVVVGAGPAGYFAALALIKRGFQPIVIERGKDVQARRRDLRAIMQESTVNPDSNYCFGEGGAGTYSDGKLYTRSTKRGDVREVLYTFCEHGAASNILVDAHPHIGTNKLPRILEAMRKTIESHGGQILFNKRLVDFEIHQNEIRQIVFQDGTSLRCDAVLLATGHSARDIYSLLHRHHIKIEAKPFALGVRIEHPQSLIDQIQYSCPTRPDSLPAAPYSTVVQVEGKGVFSFCMCPGGMIVPSATEPGEIVVNGMSPSRRDSPFANSGFVTSVEIDDIPLRFHDGPFTALNFQQHIEQNIFNHGDGSQQAPAQRMMDFIHGKISKDLPACSYVPGVYSTSVYDLLPKEIAKRLAAGMLATGNKMKGYCSNEALVTAVESRTSSPIRIPRDKETLIHPEIKNLYPCGEGAGYAGGIVSAGIDGVNVARKIADHLTA